MTMKWIALGIKKFSMQEATNNNEHLNDLGDLLLEVGTLLMSAGANTNRIRVTMKRIAQSYHNQAEFLITHRAIMLTIYDEKGKTFFNQVKQTYAQVPDFTMVSGISRLSWHIVEEQLPMAEVRKEIERLKSKPKYPRWVVLAAVAFACSSFCRLAGGDPLEMGAVFIAAITGLFLRQELTKKSFNPYFTVFLAAFLSTIISGSLGYFGLYEHDNITLVTSILYLIPGIPLINSISDFLDGYSLNGLVRAVNGFVISFAIASGLLIALLIYNFV